MTVYDLIQRLVRFDPNAEVLFSLWHEDEPEQDKRLRLEDLDISAAIGKVTFGLMVEK